MTPRASAGEAAGTEVDGLVAVLENADAAIRAELYVALDVAARSDASTHTAVLEVEPAWDQLCLGGGLWVDPTPTAHTGGVLHLVDLERAFLAGPAGGGVALPNIPLLSAGPSSAEMCAHIVLAICPPAGATAARLTPQRDDGGHAAWASMGDERTR
jgi:hypothetical protein